MTILDACVTILKDSQAPLPAEKIFEQIQARELYPFGAKDPLSIVRAAMRKHLKTAGPHRIKEVSPKLYALP